MSQHNVLEAPRRHEVVDLLQTMIRNRCVNDGSPASGHEERNADTLATYLEGAVSLQRFDAAVGRSSLVARIEGSDPDAPSLCLLGHTDVVPALDQDWLHDPFGGELIDDEIWGRGAVDMLNMTASMAVAFRQLAEDGFRSRGDLVFAAVADEEAQAEFGARFLLENHRDDVLTDYVITEGGGYPMAADHPVKLSWATAEKGIAWVRLVIKGTAGHASSPFGADNALATAGAVLSRLSNHNPDPVLSQLWHEWVDAMDFPDAARESLLEPDSVLESATSAGFGAISHACTHMTVSPTRIQGGTAANSIPESVALDLDVRTLPEQRREHVLQYLHAALGELMDTIDVEWRYEVESTHSPIDSPLRHCAEKVTQRLLPRSSLVPSLLTASTDAAYFRQAGARAYGFMVPSDRYTLGELHSMFHGPNERIDVASLSLTTRLWIDLARQFHDEIGV